MKKETKEIKIDSSLYEKYKEGFVDWWYNFINEETASFEINYDQLQYCFDNEIGYSEAVSHHEVIRWL